MALCAHCKERRTARTMKKNVFVIVRRGRRLNRKQFCSLKCIDTHLAEIETDWVAIGESFSPTPDGLCVHSVTVTEKTKAELVYYGDRLQNGPS